MQTASRMVVLGTFLSTLLNAAPAGSQVTGRTLTTPSANFPQRSYYRIGKDAEVPLYCSNDTVCEVFVTAPRPGRGEFRFKPTLSNAPPLTGTLTLQRRAESYSPLTLRNDPMMQGLSPSYELQSGDYLIKLQLASPLQQSKAQSERREPTGTVLLERWTPARLPLLDLQSNVSTALILDRTSARAHYEVNLKARSRLLLRLSLPSGFKKTKSYFFTAWANIVDQRIEREAEQEVPEGELFYFVLPPGRLMLTVQFRYVNNPLPADFPTTPLRLTVGHSSPVRLSRSLVPLQSWLESLKLHTTLEIQDLACKDGPDDGVPRSVQREFYQIFDVMYRDRSAISCEVFLHTALERDGLTALEDQFRQKTNTEFWERAFRKISLATNISTTRLLVRVPVVCGPSTVREVEPGVIGRFGPECTMASVRQSLDSLPFQGAQPGASTIAHERKLGPAVEPFLSTFLPHGAKLEFLDRGDDSAEVLVRNVKGHVIHGGQYWEKLQIAFILKKNKSGGEDLITFVDGFIASGLGSYPADSQFTVSMEPQYYQALSDYAKQVCAALKARLEASH